MNEPFDHRNEQHLRHMLREELAPLRKGLEDLKAMDSAIQKSIDDLTTDVNDFTTEAGNDLTTQAASITDLKAKVAALAAGSGDPAAVSAAIDAIAVKVKASADKLKAFEIAPDPTSGGAPVVVNDGTGSATTTP